MTGWRKRYRRVRAWGNETGLDRKPHEDYVGYDGNEYIGRIYIDTQTLKAGKWRWAAGKPKGCRTMPQPNNGWLPTAQEAAQQVDEYWDKLKEKACSQL